MTPLPSLDPAETHISLSRSANADFERLALSASVGGFRERRRIVVDALRLHAKPLPELCEMQFLANTVIDGVSVVALCLSHGGSPLGDKAQSVIVRGIFTQERAAELTAIGKGLQPFIQEISGRQTAGTKNKVEKNDTNAKHAIAKHAIAG